MPDPMPTQSKEPSAWAMNAAKRIVPWKSSDDEAKQLVARIIDREYAPLLDLLRAAAEHHEDQDREWRGCGELDNADYHTARAKVFRDALGGVK